MVAIPSMKKDGFTHLGIRVPVKTKEALKQAAVAEETKLSHLVLRTLNRWLRKEGFLVDDHTHPRPD